MNTYEELESFNTMVESLGYTVDEVREMSEITEDMIDMPYESPIEVKDSDIEGKGVFATEDIKESSQIGIGRVMLNRTPLGRYTNHSFTPNAKAQTMNNSMYFIATKNIKKGEEITADYRHIRKIAEELDMMINTPKQVGWSLGGEQ